MNNTIPSNILGYTHAHLVKAVTTIIARGRQVDSYKYLMTVAQHI